MLLQLNLLFKQLQFLFEQRIELDVLGGIDAYFEDCGLFQRLEG